MRSQNAAALLEEAQRVLLVHAHPDDETLATGALIAELLDRGVEVHVVTATRGECGELMPGVADVEPGSAQFAQLRERELRAALDVLGVRHHVYLGTPPARDPLAEPARVYRDSGMEWISEGVAGPGPDSGPESLTAATLSEAAADLAAYVGAVRPQVLISYDPHGGYGHPDHVRVHELTRAVAAAQGLPMLEVVPPGRAAEFTGVEWSDLSAHLPRVQATLRELRSQVTVDSADVVHVGGQREPIVTRCGLLAADGADRP